MVFQNKFSEAGQNKSEDNEFLRNNIKSILSSLDIISQWEDYNDHPIGLLTKIISKKETLIYLIVFCLIVK